MQVNAAGMVVTLVAVWLLIPAFGYTGAAITASLSYSTTVIIQYILFQRATLTTWSEWIPDKTDFLAIKSMLRTALSKK